MTTSEFISQADDLLRISTQIAVVDTFTYDDRAIVRRLYQWELVYVGNGILFSVRIDDLAKKIAAVARATVKHERFDALLVAHHGSATIPVKENGLFTYYLAMAAAALLRGVRVHTVGGPTEKSARERLLQLVCFGGVDAFDDTLWMFGRDEADALMPEISNVRHTVLYHLYRSVVYLVAPALRLRFESPTAGPLFPKEHVPAASSDILHAPAHIRPVVAARIANEPGMLAWARETYRVWESADSLRPQYDRRHVAAMSRILADPATPRDFLLDALKGDQKATQRISDADWRASVHHMCKLLEFAAINWQNSADYPRRTEYPDRMPVLICGDIFYLLAMRAHAAVHKLALVPVYDDEPPIALYPAIGVATRLLFAGATSMWPALDLWAPGPRDASALAKPLDLTQTALYYAACYTLGAHYYDRITTPSRIEAAAQMIITDSGPIGAVGPQQLYTRFSGNNEDDEYVPAYAPAPAPPRPANHMPPGVLYSFLLNGPGAYDHWAATSGEVAEFDLPPNTHAMLTLHINGRGIGAAAPVAVRTTNLTLLSSGLGRLALATVHTRQDVLADLPPGVQEQMAALGLEIVWDGMWTQMSFLTMPGASADRVYYTAETNNAVAMVVVRCDWPHLDNI